MNEQKIVMLDLTGCKYLGELHQRIKKAFNFPDFYGENWDAFWDLLRSDCDADKVEIIGEYTLSKEFDGEIEKMHKVLQDFKENCEKLGDSIDFEIMS